MTGNSRLRKRFRVSPPPITRCVLALAACVALVLAAAGCGGSGSSSGSTSATESGSTSSAAPGSSKKLHLAYFSFAVQNSYDAPMLAAAEKQAAAENAEYKVFDANNTAQTQFSQIQDAIASGSYEGFAIQAVEGSGLVPVVQQAIEKGIKVVGFSTVLGPNLKSPAPQVPGVSASVVYTGYERGVREGKLVERACESLKTDKCNVGYMYDVKASGFDQGVREGFDSVVSKNPKIEVVAEGEDFFTANGGLESAQAMLQANPDINIMCGSDQGMQGATKAIESAGSEVLIVGLGGSVAGLDKVKAGAWFGDIVTQPESEGTIATEALVEAVREGKDRGAVTPQTSLPDEGIATQANVAKFKGQWPG